MARILLVDDDTDSAEALSLYLELEGHEVQIAATAEDALGRFETSAPQLVISDLRLPGMSGEDLARRIGARRSPPKMIALSGERSAHGGFDLCLEKPCRPPDLLRAIDALLKN